MQECLCSVATDSGQMWGGTVAGVELAHGASARNSSIWERDNLSVKVLSRPGTCLAVKLMV